jgi:predicted transglutaminase-like cysteine proteinase
MNQPCPTIFGVFCRLARHWTVKVLLFALLALLVLNPNIKRGLMQVHHTFRPDGLIQVHFPGLDELNRELDLMVREDKGQTKEVKLIERFVYDQIRYVSDYENWWNIEYWPTAEEVWERRQEDCDGRAILAVSIMRSRGFSSARLVVGLNHMWVEVDANEKELHKPEKLTALLGPGPNLRIAIEKNPDARHFARLALALLHPTAFRETSGGLIADIPAPRKAILLLFLLVLCYFPSPQMRGLAPVLVAGGCAALLLFGPGAHHPWQKGIGLALLLVTTFAAILMKRLQPALRPLDQAAHPCLAGKLKPLPASNA